MKKKNQTTNPDIQAQIAAAEKERAKNLADYQVFVRSAKQTVSSYQVKDIQCAERIKTLTALLPKTRNRIPDTGK